MKTELETQEAVITENHSADVESGLTEVQACESDEFERRILGLPPKKSRRPDGDWNDWGSNDY